MIKEEKAVKYWPKKSIGRNRWSSTLVGFSGHHEEDIFPVASMNYSDVDGFVLLDGV
jgi:hypothetical protein